ncbi:hypothetical protein MC885_021500 [Smutsia gigantea]|nr:hypothetical protein MC885_021500 [Smutsia gigantea]
MTRKSYGKLTLRKEEEASRSAKEVPAGLLVQAVQEHILFHVIQISSFANQSWAHHQSSGWLDELQTHGWESESGRIIFLHTGSKGNFSNGELTDVEWLFCVYIIRLTWKIQDYTSQLQCEYPSELQMTADCELHSRATTESFFRAAHQGSDFLNFQNITEGDSRARSVCVVINQYEGIKETVHRLIRNTCPRFALGFRDAGKMDLQRQESSSENLHVLCSETRGLAVQCSHRWVWPPVAGMPRLWFLPKACVGDVDVRRAGAAGHPVVLDVEAEEAAGLACWIRHGSVGAQDIVLHWGTIGPVSVRRTLLFHEIYPTGGDNTPTVSNSPCIMT